MTGYIERKVLYQAFVFYAGKRIPEVDVDGLPITVDLQTIKKTIRELPAADVAPVVHARWKWKAPYMVCSACNRHSINRYQSKRCQHCGAHMDERSDEK